MKFNGVSDDSVAVRRADEIIEDLAEGVETLPALSRPLEVQKRVKEIIEAGGLVKAQEEKLRKARINMLMTDEDPEVAVEGIKLSQKEHGIGNAPSVVQQFNMGEPPQKMKELLEGEETE